MTYSDYTLRSKQIITINKQTFKQQGVAVTEGNITGPPRAENYVAPCRRRQTTTDRRQTHGEQNNTGPHYKYGIIYQTKLYELPVSVFLNPS